MNINSSNFTHEELTAIQLFMTQYTGSTEELEPKLDSLLDKIVMCSKAIQKGYAFFFIASMGEKNNEFMRLIDNHGFMVEPTKDKFINRVWIVSNLNKTDI